MDLGFAAAQEGEGDWGDDDDDEAAPSDDDVVLAIADGPPVAAAAPKPGPTKEPAAAGAPNGHGLRRPGIGVVTAPAAAAAAAGGEGAAAGEGAAPLPPPPGGPRPGSKIHSNPRTRYFVIKSSSHKNLVLSVENNVWATPRHNEDKFNEAMRSAPHVILIFSVNTSGCFQGYAKMTTHVGESKKTNVFPGFAGKHFDVRWLRLDDLDFREVSDIVNPWNDHKSVKISRDGQELPNDVGRRVCEMVDDRVWRADPKGFVTDENEVETGGFGGGGGCGGPPHLPSSDPMTSPGAGSREGISPGAWAPPTMGPPPPQPWAPGAPWAPPGAPMPGAPAVGLPPGMPPPHPGMAQPMGFIHPSAWRNPWAESSYSSSYSYSDSEAEGEGEKQVKEAIPAAATGEVASNGAPMPTAQSVPQPQVPSSPAAAPIAAEGAAKEKKKEKKEKKAGKEKKASIEAPPVQQAAAPPPVANLAWSHPAFVVPTMQAPPFLQQQHPPPPVERERRRRRRDAEQPEDPAERLLTQATSEAMQSLPPPSGERRRRRRSGAEAAPEDRAEALLRQATAEAAEATAGGKSSKAKAPKEKERRRRRNAGGDEPKATAKEKDKGKKEKKVDRHHNGHKEHKKDKKERHSDGRDRRRRRNSGAVAPAAMPVAEGRRRRGGERSPSRKRRRRREVRDSGQVEPEVAMCPRSHALRQEYALGLGGSCDQCGAPIGIGAVTWGCRPCNWCLCTGCHGRLFAKVAAPPGAWVGAQGVGQPRSEPGAPIFPAPQSMPPATAAAAAPAPEQRPEAPSAALFQ